MLIGEGRRSEEERSEESEKLRAHKELQIRKSRPRYSAGVGGSNKCLGHLTQLFAKTRKPLTFMAEIKLTP